MDIFRKHSLLAANFIGQSLIITDSEPIFTTVRCSSLQQKVKLFYHGFCQFLFRMVDDKIDTTEMIDRLNHIIHIDHRIYNADCIRIIYIACLLMSKPAALNMI